ncbi:MAG: DUF1579 family protein [Acidobacteria bacterium]|nr:DUF1579 family protein [Acidobacteriota bacterium]
MLRAQLTWVALLAAAAPAALAQAPERPVPGPEHKKLEFFVGKWKGEADMKPNPFVPGGKYNSTDTCEWFDGNFAVVCRSEGSGPAGQMKSLGLIGYSPEEKVYTYYGLDNGGMMMTSVARGTLQGDTWTFVDEAKMGGKTVKSRYTMRQLSPTSYSFKWETVGDKGEWVTVMEGKQTKI